MRRSLWGYRTGGFILTMGRRQRGLFKLQIRAAPCRLISSVSRDSNDGLVSRRRIMMPTVFSSTLFWSWDFALWIYPYTHVWASLSKLPPPPVFMGKVVVVAVCVESAKSRRGVGSSRRFFFHCRNLLIFVSVRYPQLYYLLWDGDYPSFVHASYFL